jgi:citrate lyase subunit beta/citryl-CoA lyase/(S)-citramalyl-CoA lyase
MSPAQAPRRSLLFAPANRPEVHAKALAAPADVVCLDLEDAVPPGAKAEARALALPFLAAAGRPGPERALRINALRSAEGLRDILAVIEARPPAGVIFLPKVATADELRLADELLTEAGLPLALAVLIESVEGLENAAAILRASRRIAFAMFGGVDLAAELGVAVAHEPLLYARQRLVHAARLAGVDLLDVPSLAFRDIEAVRAEAEIARALGFTGKAAIHPATLATVNAVFTPSEAEVARAEAIVAAWQTSPTGLVVLDGKLIEKPVIRSMERVLALRDLTTR